MCRAASCGARQLAARDPARSPGLRRLDRAQTTAIMRDLPARTLGLGDHLQAETQSQLARDARPSARSAGRRTPHRQAALGIAEKIFAPSGRTPVRGFEPYRMYPGSADCGAFRDFGLCVYFKAPHSFTGEDVVEFHCHGGTAITRGILKRAVSLGARLAERGEFTKRAFLNGKLSLASAEGLVDMINGESDAQVRAGYMLYSERLTGKMRTLQGELTEILAGIDADIDFPEEDIEHTDLKDVREKIDHIAGELAALSATYGVGKKVKEGVSVVLAGRPNTGKSSVLNALLGADNVKVV